MIFWTVPGVVKRLEDVINDVLMLEIFASTSKFTGPGFGLN